MKSWELYVQQGLQPLKAEELQEEEGLELCAVMCRVCMFVNVS